MTFAVLGEIRKRCTEKLPRMPLGAVPAQSSGALKNTLIERIDSIETTLAHIVPEFTANLLIPVIITVHIFTIDWRMGLPALWRWGLADAGKSRAPGERPEPLSAGVRITSITAARGCPPGRGCWFWRSSFGASDSVSLLYLGYKGMSPPQSRMLPSREIVTTCHGMNFPLFRSAFSAARCRPPQQGTSMRTMFMLLISLSRMIAVSFSE